MQNLSGRCRELLDWLRPLPRCVCASSDNRLIGFIPFTTGSLNLGMVPPIKSEPWQSLGSAAAAMAAVAAAGGYPYPSSYTEGSNHHSHHHHHHLQHQSVSPQSQHWRTKRKLFSDAKRNVLPFCFLTWSLLESAATEASPMNLCFMFLQTVFSFVSHCHMMCSPEVSCLLPGTLCHMQKLGEWPLIQFSVVDVWMSSYYSMLRKSPKEYK